MNRMRRIGGNEVSEKMIRLGLIVMVALSFYFSYMIWLNPTRLRSFSRTSYRYSQYEYSDLQTKKVILFLPLYFNLDPPR